MDNQTNVGLLSCVAAGSNLAVPLDFNGHAVVRMVEALR